jgi:crotonobetainyl-CoA:carnitine CoA-transferase CaiB-like acyl-CoA transferase
MKNSGAFGLKEDGTHMAFLNGVTVIELGENTSASACTKWMAALGASVIKIEAPDRGDPARRMGPFPNDDPHPEKSGLFLYLNMGKKGITLNLHTKEGKNIFLNLVAKADILVEDLGAGKMEELGLHYEVLKERIPHLVFTSITSFGEKAPYSHYQAENIILEALSGMMLQYGNPEREPLKMGGNIIYYRAGATAFSGSLAALLHAEATGEGQLVEVSIQECLLHDDFITVETYLARGEDVRRRLAPMLLPCSDGWFYIRAFPHEWPRLTQTLEFPELEKDERFIDMEKRSQHAEELNTIILSRLGTRGKKEIYDELQKNHVTAGYLANIEDLFQSEQYHSHGYFITIDHPVAGPLTYPGSFATMENIEWKHGRAPLFGEHNAEILGQMLGYNPEDLARLRQLGVI